MHQAVRVGLLRPSDIIRKLYSRCLEQGVCCKTRPFCLCLLWSDRSLTGKSRVWGRERPQPPRGLQVGRLDGALHNDQRSHDLQRRMALMPQAQDQGRR